MITCAAGWYLRGWWADWKAGRQPGAAAATAAAVWLAPEPLDSSCPVCPQLGWATATGWHCTNRYGLEGGSPLTAVDHAAWLYWQNRKVTA